MKYTVKISKLGLIPLIFLFLTGCYKEPSKKQTLEEKKEDPIRIKVNRRDLENKVEVWIDGELFTQYMYPENIKKPILYPLKTASGTLVTRGWPLEPRPFERIDHPHQVGLWFNHGDVNGLDFWGNSDSIPEIHRDHCGTIYHKSIKTAKSGEEEGILVVTSEWKRPDGRTLILETTKFVFSGTDSTRVIDRISTLQSQGLGIRFQDTKEGMLGLRYARELEHPEGQTLTLFDENLNPVQISADQDTLPNGWYTSSEGIQGLDVWGTRARWMKLTGEMNGETVSIIMMDHPENPNYPTHWHARGYGLFSANAFGSKMFTNNREEFNFFLSSDESVTFRYRIIIHNGSDLTSEVINRLHDEFIAEND